MAAVLYCNGTIICNFGEKSGSLLGKNPASMGGSLASTKKNLIGVLHTTNQTIGINIGYMVIEIIKKKKKWSSKTTVPIPVLSSFHHTQTNQINSL